MERRAFPQYILPLKFQTGAHHQDGCPVQVNDRGEIDEKILDINFRTVAKAMGGRTTGQIGVRGLASEKKVRIGDEDSR